MLRCARIAELTATGVHQVALFGREDESIPIDEVESAIGIDQDVARVQIRMAHHDFRRLSLQRLREPFSTRDEIENLSAFGLQIRREFYRNGIVKDVSLNACQRGLDDLAPARRIGLCWMRLISVGGTVTV